MFLCWSKINYDIKYDLVFVSWKSEEPQKDIDQYLAWINEHTGLIDFVEFTIRDESKLITAVAEYKKYHEEEGILIPTTIGIKMKINSKKFIHKMSLHSIKFKTTSLSSLKPLIGIQSYEKH